MATFQFDDAILSAKVASQNPFFSIVFNSSGSKNPTRKISFTRRFRSILATSLSLWLFGMAEPILAADNGKLKVFILAGQSNMEGWGKVEQGGNPNTTSRDPNVLGGLGSLRAMVMNNPSAYSYLLDTSKTVTYSEPGNASLKKTFPAWATRNDVWVSSWGSVDLAPANTTFQIINGPLSVGFGGRKELPEGFIGPEFGFGQMVGNALADKVLLIKTAWGRKELSVAFRPPSSSGGTGDWYKEMIAKVRLVLANVKTYYPAYDGAGYELAGFGWHQGWNDRINAQYAAEYETNLANLIRDVRSDLGVPKLPFVLAVEQQVVDDYAQNAHLMLMAQQNITTPSMYPEFAGTVVGVDTAPFYYGENSPSAGMGHHWNLNGESYFHIGESMGTAMVKLIQASSSSPPGRHKVRR